MLSLVLWWAWQVGSTGQAGGGEPVGPASAPHLFPPPLPAAWDSWVERDTPHPSIPQQGQGKETRVEAVTWTGWASEHGFLWQVHPLLPHPRHVLQRLFHRLQGPEHHAQGCPAAGGAQWPVLLVSDGDTWVVRALREPSRKHPHTTTAL